MSWSELRDNVDLYEYWCLLAEAMDADELEDFNLAHMVYIGVNDPKRLKKWKWSSPDRAGTRPLAINPAASVTRFLTKDLRMNLKPTGSGLEYARATGREVVYADEEGHLFDDQLNPLIERPKDAVVLRLEHGHND